MAGGVSREGQWRARESLEKRCEREMESLEKRCELHTQSVEKVQSRGVEERDSQGVKRKIKSQSSEQRKLKSQSS